MIRRALCLFVLLAVWAFPVAAQVEQTATWIQSGEFALDYPADWQVQTDPALGFVYLQQAGLQVTVYSPQVLAAYGLDAYNPQTLLSLIVALNGVSAAEPEALNLGKTTAAAVRYQNPATGNAGWLIAREFRNHTVGLIDAFAPAPLIGTNADLIVAMAASFDVPPIPAPEVLVDSGAAWSQVVDELEASGFIAPGGTLVFAEPYVFASGTNLTQPLAASVVLSDLVMAGSLRYTPSANPTAESCGMLARQAGEGVGLEVGLRSGGELYLAQSDEVQILQSGLDVSRAYSVVFTAVADRLVVYLDGQQVADVEIPAGSGHGAIRIQGDGPGAACEVSNLWVYRVPAAEPGVCEITADGGAVNKRSGPGTQYDVAGVLEAGAMLSAQAQASDGGSFAWWQLADGTWVREDVVREQGACRALPAGS